MIKIFDSIEKLNVFAAEKIVEIAAALIRSKGNFTIALAGGSTPKALYQLLWSEEYKNKIDWTKVFFFFGDERTVPPDSEESNFRMANENLFAPLQIADENIFRWKTERLDAELIAADYELTILNFFDSNNDLTDFSGDSEFPQFDLILLGMGDDGHTASLFPASQALNEKELIAAANPVEKLNTTRLTLTFPVINNARNVIFLVKGADKAETLREVLHGEFQPHKLPSQNVKPAGGNLFWLVDETAARFLM
jgi:6-phosphogluconolactonase